MFWTLRRFTPTRRPQAASRLLSFERLEDRVTPALGLASAFAVGDAGEWARDVVADAAGNSYVTGIYNRTVDFDRSDADPATNPNLVLTSTTYPNPNSPTGSSPNQEAFVAKYDPTGACVWAVPVGRGGWNSGERLAIDVDPSHRGVVVTGYFQGVQSFGAYSVTSSGDTDAYVARLDDATGALQWVRQWGGAYGIDHGYGVAVDAEGSAYATGRLNLTSGNLNNNFDVYVAKYALNGTTVWQKQFGGSSQDVGRSITLDRAGNVLVGGDFRGTADFNPDPAVTYSLTSGGRSVDPSTAGFVVKLTQATGAFVWASHFQANQWSSSAVVSLGTDAANNVYAVGNFTGTVDFNPNKKAAYKVTSSSDGFAVRLDPQGKFAWQRTFGGDSNFDVYGATVDSLGNIYVTGSFRGTVDLDPGAGTFSRTAVSQEEDVFVMKLGSSGSFVWGAAMGGAGQDRGQGIAVDGFGNVYVVGLFGGQANFNPDPAGTPYYLYGNPGYAMFYVKLTQS